MLEWMFVGTLWPGRCGADGAGGAELPAYPPGKRRTSSAACCRGPGDRAAAVVGRDALLKMMGLAWRSWVRPPSVWLPWSWGWRAHF